MKILIDECLPVWLAKQLVGHAVRTVQQMGWSAMKDPELITQVLSGLCGPRGL